MIDRFTAGKLCRTDELREIAGRVKSPYLMLEMSGYDVGLGKYSEKRFTDIILGTGAAMVYSDYVTVGDRGTAPHPVIDYQQGSLRDDFDFGAVMVVNSGMFREAVEGMDHDYKYAALYDLRLRLSRQGDIRRIPEYLYSVLETDRRLSGEKQFDYVDPRNREVQIEMEHACTAHLKAIGGWLAPEFEDIDLHDGNFPVECSVVIPVKDRAGTVADAIYSVLDQRTEKPFNVIIVDNHSTDGTTEIIKSMAAGDPRIVHIIPERKDLGIGGCWNEAVLDSRCGRFAVQLDSDDLYIDNKVLRKIADKFYEERCAMVVGSYRMVNFSLEEIPPGVIDHREWTPDNGLNNALRINGLGAPRAFYTPVIREILFPNVSYGEDYAAALAVSRRYKIGRIYDPLYLCRRWEGNSDAALSVERVNANNFFKDNIRTVELAARQRINRNGSK